MRALIGPRLSLTWLASLSLSLAAGCGPSAPPAAQAPAPPATKPAGPALSKDGWGVLRSNALGLKLALPEARAWLEATPRAPRGAWELRHEPTGSTLVLRRWRASRLPQLDACEREARQRSADLPEIDETNLVATRTVRAPVGFFTRVSLLSLPGTSARLKGLAIAIGAGVGECLEALASTECSSEEELAERLRLFDTALGHLRLIHVEDRVPEPAPAAP